LAKKEKSINLILRADVDGSLDPIEQSLAKLKNPEIKIKILRKGLGDITESDVDLAKTANGWLISFGTKINPRAEQLAKESGVKISTHYVIYDLVDEVKEEINNLLSPEIFEEKIGKLEVMKIFQQKAKETILGAKVLEGKIKNDSIIRVWTPSNGSEPELKGEGKIKQLQANKQDVIEVKLGSECGIKFIGPVEIQEKDILEVYQEIKKQRKI